jgi:hypothetical protein
MDLGLPGRAAATYGVAARSPGCCAQRLGVSGVLSIRRRGDRRAEVRGRRRHDGQTRSPARGRSSSLAPRWNRGRVHHIHHPRAREARKQGELTNRPCLGFVYEESHSKRTSTRQQLDCSKTL